MPSRRAGYYRIVGHYGETTLIPLLFDGISDPSPDVWGACISSIYEFGEKAFPFVDRYIQSGDYLMSLSCLQILEAIKSEKSLPMLISFYGNANRMLAPEGGHYRSDLRGNGHSLPGRGDRTGPGLRKQTDFCGP